MIERCVFIPIYVDPDTGDDKFGGPIRCNIKDVTATRQASTADGKRVSMVYDVYVAYAGNAPTRMRACILDDEQGNRLGEFTVNSAVWQELFGNWKLECVRYGTDRR